MPPLSRLKGLSQSALSRAAYPVAIVASVLAADALVQSGAPAPLAIGIVSTFSAAFAAGLERVIPYARVWGVSRRDVLTDTLHLTVSTVAAQIAFHYGALVLPSSWVLGIWPSSWPLAAQLALALLIAELGGYWTHRAMHAVPALFRPHAIHHSSERLYWRNAGRLHPIDTFITLVATTIPLMLLGAGPSVVTAYAAFTVTHLLLQHANADLRLGLLNHVVSMCEVHRWHHSRNLEEANANYGNILIVWDHVFGTRRVPKHAPPLNVGLVGDQLFPNDYLAQLAAPFKREEQAATSVVRSQEVVS